MAGVALRARQPSGAWRWARTGRVRGILRYDWIQGQPRQAAASDGPMRRGEDLARLEAVLVVAREPLGSRKLAQLAGLADGTKARTLVRALNRMYDAEGCAFRAVEVAGGFQLTSRPKFAAWLSRLYRSQSEVRLSGPVLETLAVVAYRQPVLRAEVEAVRGVQCGEILRQLMERELVRIVGRSEELGRPFLYGTTKRFLQVFGLRHLDELPRRDWFQTARADAEITRESRPTIPSLPLHEESNVKSVADPTVSPEILAQEDFVLRMHEAQAQAPYDDPDDEDDDEYEYEDEDGDDEDADDEEDFEDEEDEDEDEDFDDEDFEDEEWEEVEDDEEEDEEDEDDDWDDDEDDWDDDEDDEDDEEEKDWE